MAEKMRVHILAKSLNVPSKVIITKCRAEGLKVTNHMSTLTAGLEATIREWFSDGQHNTTMETTTRVNLAKVRVRKKRTITPTISEETVSAATIGTEGEAATAVAEAPPATVVGEPPIAGDDAPPVSEDEAASPLAPAAETVTEVAAEAPAEAEAAVEVESPVEEPPSVDSSAAVAESVAEAGETKDSSSTSSPVSETAVEPAAKIAEDAAAPPAADALAPAGPQNIPRPAKLKGPRVVRYEPVEPSVPPPPSRRRSPDAVTPAQPVADAGLTDAAARRRRPTHVGESAAAKSRAAPRRISPSDAANEKLKEWRDRDLVERQERISDATGRRIHTRRAVDSGGGGRQAAPAPPKTEATVQEPIIMKDLCAAAGISMLQILPTLQREFGVMGNINLELSSDMAEYVAAEHGVTLTVVPARTALDEIEEEFANRKPGQMKHRPPVVTFLGHVDHGKTSLLDKIRSARVADTEDGGITQHIGAYHLDHETAGKVTFLDTPGHEAFTAMRARGAQMTDIVVLVVAADDGVMPQTIEAINHAKAAEVPIVVALNKIDLGTQNLTKIYGQLSEHGLAPSGDWGGDTDVIQTSASTGQGIDELIEHLSALGEVLDIKADYSGDAAGAVIEAEMQEGVGAVARALVQQGTLRTGSIVVCGNAFGKVRALIGDRGQRLKEAPPSIPVEIWGLDEVPMAGDRFYQVKSMQRAKFIAEDCRQRRVQEGRSETRRARSLEDVFKQRDEGEIPELNIIIKADVDGSIQALRGMFAKLPSDEVRLAVRHAAVGGVTDSDVLLADASNAVVIAFRVSTVTSARRLADEKGVDVRQYKVIYDAGEDIKKALEGLLAPDEREEKRATCEVREVFRVSKVGVVAGSVVVDGTIKRNHLVRLIRDGVVVRQGCKVASLRRFKDDAKEIRTGLECGVRLENFDDVKPGDVIEAYEIVKTARTL